MKKIIYIIFYCLVSVTSKAQDEHFESARQKDITTQGGVDIKRKALEIKQLATNAAKYFLNHSIDTACNEFIYKSIWHKGELFPFVIREDGVVYAHGEDTNLIWQNISNIKGVGGRSLLKEMLSIPKGHGYMSYAWDNSSKAAYIQIVKKNGKRFIIGSGFFPENDEFLTKRLVRSAANFFMRDGKEATFGLINNPNGPFVNGDIYIFVYDFKGVCVAHGQNTALVGQNLIDQVDSRGNPITRQLIELAQNKGSGWVDYYWRNELKRAYVERVQDPKTKKYYLIGAGYYPNLTLDTVTTLVKRAIRYIKNQGAKDAFSEFNNAAGEFALAGVGLFVYDFNGKSLANSENPSYVGQNLLKVTDQDGRPIVKEIINAARKKGKALISYTKNNSYSIAYVEAVDVPDGKFVIGANYYPASKAQLTRSLVARATEAITESSDTNAFVAFRNRRGSFYKGDLSIFVYDTKGTRLANGDQTTQLWRNFMRATDQDGKPVVGNIIATAVNGGGWVEYKTRNATRRVYVRSVDAANKAGRLNTLIIGSGYFL